MKNAEWINRNTEDWASDFWRDYWEVKLGDVRVELYRLKKMQKWTMEAPAPFPRMKRFHAATAKEAQARTIKIITTFCQSIIDMAKTVK